jgi:hypothetical protein
MATLEEKRVDWLYEHFQAISAAGNHYLLILALVAGFSLAGLLSNGESFYVPILGLTIDRDLVMSGSILIGAFYFVAYCGNYDKGEATISRLCDELKCEYEDLEFIDKNPNPIDFARYVRPAAAQQRGYFARLLAALLYPSILILGLAWFTALSLSELFFRAIQGAPLVIYALAILTLWFAWGRAKPFFSRRWQTFIAFERQLPKAPAA